MADASTAITEGFTNVFGPPKTRLMCFFHVIKSVEKYLKPLKEKDEIKKDIHTLQICKERDVFKIGAELFIKKWQANENVKEFLKYFEKQWLNKNDSWYEGAAIGYPSTNNGIEATNSVLKKHYTFRERLPVGQFFILMENIINNWSTARDPQSPNRELYNEIRCISLK